MEGWFVARLVLAGGRGRVFLLSVFDDSMYVIWGELGEFPDHCSCVVTIL